MIINHEGLQVKKVSWRQKNTRSVLSRKLSPAALNIWNRTGWGLCEHDLSRDVTFIVSIERHKHYFNNWKEEGMQNAHELLFSDVSLQHVAIPANKWGALMLHGEQTKPGRKMRASFSALAVCIKRQHLQTYFDNKQFARRVWQKSLE